MSFLRHRRKHFRSNPNFVIQVKTDNTGTSGDDQIMLPIQGTNMVIDWGDGSAPETVTQASTPNNTLVGGNNIVHTYSSAGTYEISISNSITWIHFNNGGDKSKLIVVKNWGNAVWTSFVAAFYGCHNVLCTAGDVPNLTFPPSLSYAFYWAFLDIETPIANIEKWDTKNITVFSRLFRAKNYQNPNVSSWDTSSGISLDHCFDFMTSFKRDISSWNFESATALTNFLRGCNINETGTTTNYDALLNSIAEQNVNNSLTFHGGNAQYSTAGETARWQLIAVHDSALADASGTDKSTYDAEAAGFQYWDTGESKIYIKKAATSGAWIGPLNLGKSWTITDGGLA